jgi:hypothetical protein
MVYQLHDMSGFPFVALRSSACTPGFGATWGAEMDAMPAAGEPFVVAFEPSAIDETPEDFRLRAQWFKVNRQLLAGRCAGMVAIVPSAEQREGLADDLAKRSHGFGAPYLALESFEAAAAATPRLIERSNRQASVTP